jgi:hypothetical protein
MPVVGILIGGFTLLFSVSVQTYALLKRLRDPGWNPTAIPSQVDSKTYSMLTIGAKMIIGSPLRLPLALMSAVRRRANGKSDTDTNVDEGR